MNDKQRRDLKKELAELKKDARNMNPKHYTYQSEYHRIMYSYTLKMEVIKSILNPKPS